MQWGGERGGKEEGECGGNGGRVPKTTTPHAHDSPVVAEVGC